MTENRDTLPGSTRVGRTALVVNDLGRAVDFYRDVVGLERHARGPGAAVLGAGNASFLQLVEDEGVEPRSPESAGLYHVAFRVPSRPALADAFDRVRSEWRLDGASDHLVSEALYLSDPEDNGVEIYRDRPRGEWPTTAEGRVAMDTVPLDLEDLSAAGSGADACPDGTSIGHVHLEVSSLGATRQFYENAIGLRVRQELGESALFLAAGDYHHHLGANTWHARSAPASGRGLDWFELVVPGRRALETLRGRLSERDIQVVERDGGIGVIDPDGIEVRVRVD